MKPFKHILFSLFIIIILIPTLFFPISSDLAVFNLAAKTILKGSKLYVDFIDIKTPQIYLLNVLNQIVFGNSEAAFRFFDFLWQVLTSISIVFIFYKINKNYLGAYLASIIYCLLYATLHYSQTYQCEGFLGLPLLWLVYLQIRTQNKTLNYFLQGFILGFIIALKITFGIIFLAILVVDIINRISTFELIRKYGLILISSIIGFIFFSFPLINKQSFDGFITMLDYLKHYNEYSYLTLEWVRYSLLLLTKYLADTLSIFILFLALIGVYLSLGKNFEPLTTQKYFFQVVVVIGLFLLLSVIVERKFHSYHFSRLYVLIGIISSYGSLYFFKKIINYLYNSNILRKTLMILLLIIGVFFTPIPRYFNLLIPTYLYLTDSNKYDDYYQRNDATLLRKDYIDISKKLKEISNPNDSILVISIGANSIYYFLGANSFSSFASSSFYLSQYLPEAWENIIKREIATAKCIIIQTNDVHPLLTGHPYSSWTAFNCNSNLKSLLDRDFYLFESKGPFKIFRKKI
jgi:hypothetical protein